jgi:hypothetical protein
MYYVLHSMELYTPYSVLLSAFSCWIGWEVCQGSIGVDETSGFWARRHVPKFVRPRYRGREEYILHFTYYIVRTDRKSVRVHPYSAGKHCQSICITWVRSPTRVHVLRALCSIIPM